MNRGKRKGRSYSMLRPDVLVISAESLDDPRHFFAIVSTKRQGPEIAPRAKLEHHRGGALLVWGLEYRDQVIRTNGPVDLLDVRPMLVGECVGLIATVHGILSGPYPLVGPVH